MEPAKDIAFRAHDGNAPAGGHHGLVEDIAVVLAKNQLLHALFPLLHVLSQFANARIGAHQILGEDALIEKFLGIRVHQESAAAAHQDAIGMRVRFNGRNGLGEPLQ